MNESYIDREFKIPACAHLLLSGLSKEPDGHYDLNHPVLKTKEYTGRKRILFEYSEMELVK